MRSSEPFPTFKPKCRAVAAMNCHKPAADAGERASGLKFDSIIARYTRPCGMCRSLNFCEIMSTYSCPRDNTDVRDPVRRPTHLSTRGFEISASSDGPTLGDVGAAAAGGTMGWCCCGVLTAVIPTAPYIAAPLAHRTSAFMRRRAAWRMVVIDMRQLLWMCFWSRRDERRHERRIEAGASPPSVL